MDKYISPGVYVESVSSVVSVDDSLSTGIGGFIGISERGPRTPTLISSWQEYIDTFAFGMDSPFLSNSSLAFAVYGFFQNGGKQCYVQKAARGGTQSMAEVVYRPAGTEVAPPLFTLRAIERGVWGNNLSCVLSQPSPKGNYILTIKYNGNTVETFKFLWDGLASAIATSRFVVLEGSISEDAPNFTNPSEVTTTFGGGNEENIPVLEYWKFDGPVERLNYITISDEVLAGLKSEEGAETFIKTFFDVIAERKETVFITFGNMRLKPADDYSIPLERIISYYPKVNVPDPLNSGALREVSPVGHVMGVLARIAQERGIWKAPAGTECTLKGVVSVAESVNVGRLRKEGVNAIIYKPNYGVVIWGAVTQALNNDMAYVTDVLLDCYIKSAIDTALQPAVFEPNNSALWVRVKADIESILDTLWRAGGLAGSEASQAYYVKCDEELNPESVRDAGELRVEVGYARNRPAEFIIVRVAHSINRS